MQKLATPSKGFAPPKPQTARSCYQPYTAELKRRFLTDNSELLIGTAEILVPKRLHDPIARERKRTVWDYFATAAAYHLLFLEESQQLGVNQVFVFDNQFRVIERIELNPWQEKHSESGDGKEVENTDLELIHLASQECQFTIEWMETPQVA